MIKELNENSKKKNLWMKQLQIAFNHFNSTYQFFTWAKRSSKTIIVATLMFCIQTKHVFNLNCLVQELVSNIIKEMYIHLFFFFFFFFLRNKPEKKN